MKIVLTILFLGVAFAGLAQDTTPEEYNYMKTEYKIALEAGKPVKPGYKDILLETISLRGYKVTFTLLKRVDSTIAGIIIRSQKNTDQNLDNKTIKWYCIPAVKGRLVSYGWISYNDELEKMEKEELLAITYGLSQVLTLEFPKKK